MIYPVNFPGVNRSPDLGAWSVSNVARCVERGARFAPRAALALVRVCFSLIGGGGGGRARRGKNLLLALVR
jgi:hypothetical protein